MTQEMMKQLKEGRLVAWYMHLGEEDFRAGLEPEAVTVEVLHKAIRDNGLDSSRRTARWKDKARLVEYIVQRTRARATKGNSYLTYQG